MESSGNGDAPLPVNGAHERAVRIGSFSPRDSYSKIKAIHRKGPGSLVNLSLYAFGISGLWTALGTPILPIKVDEIVSNNGSSIFGFLFDENDKNGALGIVSLTGLAMAGRDTCIADIPEHGDTGTWQLRTGCSKRPDC